MDIFGVFTMVGGLALFLYGMHIMGEGLSKLSGGKMERILEKLTSNPIMAVLLGAGVTAIIQSSSATTVMVVGFVNSGIMKLKQTVGIIMGANIGTTITSWILSLAGLEGESFFIKMLKPTSFSPILALMGVVLILFTKKEKKHNIGTILVGFAILMTGMSTMSDAVKPLADVPEFTGILTMFSNPILGMLAGIALTAIIQSSSASVGILQALCATGTLPFSTAFPIIMGQNIGTCITALISGIGASKNAKRAAFIHLYFNVIGTLIFMFGFYGINAVVGFEFLSKPATSAGIAVVHSVFNVTATLILLPFGNLLVKLACFTIRGEDGEGEDKEFVVLDERFLEQPAFAIEQCRTVTNNMADLVLESFDLAASILDNYNEEDAAKIIAMEDRADKYEDAIGTYLVKLNSKDMSEKDSQTASVLLHSIGDLERISDHTVNIMEASKEMYEKNLQFSPQAKAELTVYIEAMREIVSTTIDVFKNSDARKALNVEPLEEVIDSINGELRARHIERLKQGLCTIELGFVLSDIVTNFERVSDHCSNLAICIIQVRNNEFDAHEYLLQLKREDNEEFNNMYKAAKKKYALPS